MKWEIDKTHKTQGGVYPSLNKSEFYTKKIYNDMEVFYLFSSEFYKNKFDDGVDNFRENEKSVLFKKYGVPFEGSEHDFFLDLSFYTNTEYRGFMVEIGGKICINPNQGYELGKKTLMR